MAITKEQLAKIISGPAKELCLQQMNETNKSRKTSFNNPSVSDYDSDADYFDSLYYDNSDTYSQPSSNDFYITNESIQRSKLPDAIKESMIKHPIDVSGLDNTSVLPPVKKEKKITENKERRVQPTNVPSSIDYALIKTIVNDCLSNYFNENGYLSKIQLKSGNIIITDNKGETYVAKLEKINKQ